MNPMAIMGVSQIGLSALGGAAQAKAQMGFDQYNVTALRQEANQASDAAAANEAGMIRRDAMDLGEQGAAIGQANIGMGGSSQGVIRQSASEARLNQLKVWYQGDIERNSLENQANYQQYQLDEIKRSRKPGFLEQITDPINLIAPGLGFTKFSATGALRSVGLPTAQDLLNSSSGGSAIAAGTSALMTKSNYTGIGPSISSFATKLRGDPSGWGDGSPASWGWGCASGE